MGNHYKTDPELGERVRIHLRGLGIETPMANTPIDREEDRKAIEKAFSDIMECLNLDMSDDSLCETPRRVAEMYVHEIFGGLNYDNFPKCTTVENKAKYDEVVLVRDSVLRSTCEHHFQPIYGRIHIGYLPNGKVLGLSKVSRVASFLGARPQIQERLTEQVYAALSFILDTEDVAVVIEAEHFCMRMRGVEDACSDTVTSKMGGRFRNVPALREEVMALINGKKR